MSKELQITLANGDVLTAKAEWDARVLHDGHIDMRGYDLTDCMLYTADGGERGLTERQFIDLATDTVVQQNIAEYLI